jgi:transcriptional regulator GlxA family with amidase domain
MTLKVYFFISPGIVLLDLAGVVQVFHECSTFGIDYELLFVGISENVKSSAGLGLNLISDFNLYTPGSDDIIIVSGFTFRNSAIQVDPLVLSWLQSANRNEATICSICTGAFTLAKAGLLNNKKCTTHWRYTESLQNQFPALKVQCNKVFVKDENIITSAGIVTGIDLALFLLEERHGNRLSMRVARELVVYARRGGEENQSSVYLHYRDHNEGRIHKVQDYIIQNLDKNISLEKLADQATCTSRNLTRIFKAKTGITISKFIKNIRVERANHLMQKTDFKFEYIAQLCGFKSPKQLRNILYDISPQLKKIS